MEKIIVTLWITFGIYLMVLLAIMADLWSGVRKAKKKEKGCPTLTDVGGFWLHRIIAQLGDDLN